MNWYNFDAKYNNPNTDEFISKIINSILKKEKLSQNEAIKIYINNELSKYNKGNLPYLNDILAIDIFKPDEMDLKPYEEIIEIFRRWLLKQDFNFNETSENLKKIIRNDFKNYSGKINGTRSYKLLDNLIEINKKKVAIEIELSKNIANGYMTLVNAIKDKKADLGIMIVPWTPKDSGKADESLGLDKLDQLSESIDGKFPIIRLAIIRQLDIINIMKKRYSN
jgi:hypothetical protein